MCNFFSFCSDGTGKVFYFNAEQRATLRVNNPNNYNPDSHTSIVHANGFSAAQEDRLNKGEWNPLTDRLIADQINTASDQEQVDHWLAEFDITTVVPELRVSPIVNPFQAERSGSVTEHEIVLLM